MDEREQIELVTEEVKFQRALAVIEHQVKHGTSVRAACRACNVPERTFYRWLGEGVLKDYLDESRESRSQAVSSMATEALPDVMQYMIDVATGKVQVRGANPVAAAEFVFAKAGGAMTSAAEVAAQSTTQVLAFIPQLSTVRIVHALSGPDTDTEPVEVIEGEIADVEEL